MIQKKTTGFKSIAKKSKKKIIALPLKLFLVGFMGSGKTHWGQIWAGKSGIPFFDLDTRIEKAFRMSITKIFEKKGEDKFREMEGYHLRKFEKKSNFILACGGGTPCFFDNLKWMKKQGIVIYLKASPELIAENVLTETNKRPLLNDINPSELNNFIKSKLLEREPYYLQADVVLNVNELDEDSVSQFLSPAN